ncbi:hypothetical protein Hanom_Chr16g01450971 [Helianthus anomalus]
MEKTELYEFCDGPGAKSDGGGDGDGGDGGIEKREGETVVADAVSDDGDGHIHSPLAMLSKLPLKMMKVAPYTYHFFEYVK